MGRGWFGVVKFRIAKFIQPEKNCGDRAVLVAISIPIFTSQLEKSREAVDLANIRAAYAECMTAHLTDDKKGYYKEIELKQTDKTKWIIDVSDVAGKTLDSTPTNCVCIMVDKDGNFSTGATGAGKTAGLTEAK